MDKPREWYLISKDIISGSSIAEPNPPEGIDHIIVVEKSALEAACRDLGDAAKESLIEMGIHDDLKNEQGQLELEYVLARHREILEGLK